MCISGEKIGHLANSLNYNEKVLQYNNYVIVGGLNDNDRGESKDMERSRAFKQLNDLGNMVRDMLDSGQKKKLYLVALVKVPSRDPLKMKDISDTTKNMEMSNRKQGNVKMIEATIPPHNRSIFEDDLHLNQIGTTRLMQSINDEIGEFLRNYKFTANRIYSKVDTEYPWGCNVWCKEGHEEDDCELLLKMDSSHLSSPETGSRKKKDKKK